MAFLLNERVGEGTAYAHHGSLAREARLVVEERFKAGELRCVVATASLELGIDIGGVDEVILAGAPPEINAVLQRAGRSGHGVGFVSRAVVYPFHGMDLLVSAAVVGGALAGEIEALRIPRAPLDILAQVLLAMACEREWAVDELYETIRAFPPFERLARGLFDSTVEMLAGRYALPRPSGEGRGAARLRELEPRIAFDRIAGRIKARDGARALLYSSGGAIPDRGHYSMRIAGSKTRIGELDEEFVYERKVGDAFTLGAQSWRIVDIGAEAVEVLPLGQGSDFIPFWKAEARYRSAEASDRLLGLVDALKAALGGDGAGGPADSGRGAAEALLMKEARFSAEAARVAVSFLAAQSAASGGSLPGRRSVSVELYADPARRGDAHCAVIHTLRGGAINEPLALALAGAFEEAGGLSPEVISDDNFVLVILPAADGDGGPAGAGSDALVQRLLSILKGLGPRSRVEALVRSQLEGSGLFGAQFRENAGRALLLPRGSPGKRNPLWMTRLRAKRLFDAVRSYPDFPITAETWRSCLIDLFDMDGLSDLLEGLAASRISATLFRSRSPSPFAREAIWRETGEYMYQTDVLKGRPSSTLSDDVIKAAVASSRLRPRLSGDLIASFRDKARRLVPGWGPQDPAELAEWVKEIVLLPEAELAAVFASGDAGLAAAYAADPTARGRLSRVVLPCASEAVLIHEERKEEVLAEPASFVAEWLRREGPVEPARISALFGLAAAEVDSLLEELEEAGLIVIDEFRKDEARTEVLDAENLEVLLRLSRKAARPRVEARPASQLFRLVSRLQGLGPGRQEADGAGRQDRLASILSSLSGFPLPVRLWESEILPARLARYAPQELDAVLSGEGFLWYGAGRESVAFCRPEGLELFGAGGKASSLLGSGGERLDFWAIKERSGLGSREAALALWEEAWAGLATSGGFDALRKGQRNRFGRDLPEADAATGAQATGDAAAAGAPRLAYQRRLPRALRERWRDGAPVHGEWFSLELPEGAADALDVEELQAARVRAVAGRYGLLCRAILERESPLLRWPALFPAMRRMELRGELLYGRFFEGLDGPQFMSVEAFEAFGRLDEGSGGPDGPNEGFLWLNALDPAAQAAALGGAGLPPPDRLAGNRLCVGPGGLAAVLARGGRDLILPAGAGEGLVVGVAASLAGLRRRLDGRISLERVDGEVAAFCGHAGLLVGAGFERDRTRLVLW
jgi:ATP-dependent Lhr-like helicase